MERWKITFSTTAPDKRPLPRGPDRHAEPEQEATRKIREAIAVPTGYQRRSDYAALHSELSAVPQHGARRPSAPSDGLIVV
jgi:hypothetical protein